MKSYKGKENIIDVRHFEFRDFKQRITTSDWRSLLLNYDDEIIFRGVIRKLKAKNLGSGVVEISKDLSNEEER